MGSRASPNSPGFKILQAATKLTAICNEPNDERGQHESHDRVGGPDECRVRSKIHDYSAALASSRLARSTSASVKDLTRLLRISLRMAFKCMAKKRRVKPKAMTRSGIKIDGWIAGPPTFSTLAG